MNEEKITPNDFMIGTCTTMCPKQEALIRERENLLHRFEIKSGTENQKPPRADPEKIIKCYSRSAAEHKVTSSDLRPFPVLMKTIKYLFHNVFPNHNQNPIIVYDFMVDRLRAVRQDMVIQNLSPYQIICILEPIARFHIFFSYFLMGEDESKFDSYMNNTHLQECLQRLLLSYDICQDEEDSLPSCINKMKFENIYKNRCDIEGAYLLFNLHNFEAMERGARLLGTFIDNELLKMSFSWYLKNYVRVFRSFKRLPPLLLCIASSYIVEIRRHSFYALCHAFSSKNSSYPVSHLKELFLYDSDSQVIDDCAHLNIKVTGKNVNFMKKDFNASGKLCRLKRLSLIDERLQNCDLVKLLCYGQE